MKQLWRNLTPEQQLRRFKHLSPILFLVIPLSFWQFALMPAVLITALTIISWILGYQLYTLRVQYTRRLKREV